MINWEREAADGILLVRIRMLKGHKKLDSPFRTAMSPKAAPKKPWVPQPRIVTEELPSKETELKARLAEYEASDSVKTLEINILVSENKSLLERIEWLESVLPENDWRGTEFRKNMQAVIAQRDVLVSENEQLKAQLAIKRDIL